MKTISLKLLISSLVFTLFSFTPSGEKYESSKTHIRFYSHTNVEDIEATNYASISTLDTQTGEMVFSVPMQSFEFEKSLMQKHFNQEKFLNTKQFPKGKLVGRITNLHEIDFTTDGTYSAIVEGDLTIKGTTKAVSEKGTITVTGQSIKAQSNFNIILADYGVEFVKGKPSKNIAKELEISVIAEYKKE